LSLQKVFCFLFFRKGRRRLGKEFLCSRVFSFQPFARPQDEFHCLFAGAEAACRLARRVAFLFCLRIDFCV
ncbi:MAG: hypothetical protein II771_08190, partial [Clostridia bacterium]|nr:hypothetical protein [Clostridia bacterium]